MVNFQAQFVAGLSSLASPLYALLSSTQVFRWSAECDKAFAAVKTAFTQAPCLVQFNPEILLVLAADASPYGVGAVLMHSFPDGSHRPITFASQTLSVHQRRYSQLDKEALAIIFGLECF